MPVFVTEIRIKDPDFRDGRPFSGPRIIARDFADAEARAAPGVTVLGEFQGELPSNLSAKETRRRLRDMRLADAPRPDK